MGIKVGDIIEYEIYGREQFGEVMRIIKVEKSHAKQEVGRVNYTVQELNRSGLEASFEVVETDIKKVYGIKEILN